MLIIRFSFMKSVLTCTCSLKANSLKGQLHSNLWLKCVVTSKLTQITLNDHTALFIKKIPSHEYSNIKLYLNPGHKMLKLTTRFVSSLKKDQSTLSWRKDPSMPNNSLDVLGFPGRLDSSALYFSCSMIH